jgi:glutathione S-transferase
MLKSNHQALKAVSKRIEVPVLMDDDIVVVNSPDILAYLDHRYPTKSTRGPCPRSRLGASS